jgi:hypothetical protein
MEIRNYPLKRQTDPINKKEEVRKSEDKHIDQDFNGYPHSPAREEVINPRTNDDYETATGGENKSTYSTSGGNRDEGQIENKEVDNGSAGAFEETERVGHDRDQARFIDKNRGSRSKVY